MRVIYGADPMESGKIFVEGKQVRIRSCSDAIKNGIGYIPEDRKNQGVFLRNTIKWNTVINNIPVSYTHLDVYKRQEYPIRLAIEYMKKHYADKITLDEVASHSGFNPTYFSEKFKEKTGKNFTDRCV